MKKLTARVHIGKFLFEFVENLEVITTWSQFIETAKLSLPKNISWEGKSIYGGNSIFKPNDEVRIEVGYNYQYEIVFEGKIKSVGVKTPIDIECVGLGDSLKNVIIPKYSKKNVTVQALLSEISPIKVIAQGITLPQYRISNSNFLEVLEDLKNKYGVQAFVRDNTLYCGLPYTLLANTAKKHKFNLYGGVVNSDALTYQRLDEVKLKVKGISIMRDNSRIEYETGDKEGDLRTFNYYNLSAKDLNIATDNDLQNSKFEGYRGSFEAFGEPFVRYGDILTLTDSRYPEREGNYLVKGVTYNFGVGGYRQKIELERKV